MKAIVQTKEKDITGLQLQEVPVPELKSGEVLVKVAAAGVNRADLLQAQGNYPPPQGASEILGLECAGTIVDPGDTGLETGEKVAALLSGGAYAEFVAVPKGQLFPIPHGFSLTQAASIVETACTVWSNIGMLAQLRAGQTCLIHGGAGGIGTCAIQVAKALGATVAVTAGSPEKLELCKSLGADITINYRTEDFSEILSSKADVILDIIGAKYLKQNLKALAVDGHMVTIGLQGGVKGEINLGLLLAKRGTISATALRSRGLKDKATIVSSTIQHIWPLLASGQVTPHIDRVLPLEAASSALQALEDSSVTGKIVLEV